MASTATPVITVPDSFQDVMDEDDLDLPELTGSANSSMQPSQDSIPVTTPANSASVEKEVKTHRLPKKKQPCRALKFNKNENAHEELMQKQNEYYEKALQMEEQILLERMREAQLKRKAAEDEAKLKVQAAEHAAKAAEYEAKVKMQVVDYEAKLKMQAAEYNLAIARIRKEKELVEFRQAKAAFGEVESVPEK